MTEFSSRVATVMGALALLGVAAFLSLVISLNTSPEFIDVFTVFVALLFFGSLNDRFMRSDDRLARIEKKVDDLAGDRTP